MRRTVVLGANGQDGAFLVKHLCQRGYSVIGIGRQNSFLHSAPVGDFTYTAIDLRDDARLATTLAEAKPDFIFHVAAIHGSAGFQYEPVFRDMLQVNTGSLHVALEYARLINSDCHVVYASSMKVFGTDLRGTLSENTPRSTTCLYSLTKNASHDLIQYYRDHYGVTSSTLILFNHESELRPFHFFLPRLVSHLANALHGDKKGGTVKTLDFHCDWGCASEFMDIAIDVAEQKHGEDFVLASGQTWYARDLVDTLFRNHGLDYRQYVHEANGSQEDIRDQSYQVSLDRLNSRLGRVPKRQALLIAEDLLKILTQKRAADSSFGF